MGWVPDQRRMLVEHQYSSLSASWLLMQCDQLPHDEPYPQRRAPINPPSLCCFSQMLCTAVRKVTNTRSDVSNVQIPVPIIPNLHPSKTPGREPNVTAGPCAVALGAAALLPILLNLAKMSHTRTIC